MRRLPQTSSEIVAVAAQHGEGDRALEPHEAFAYAAKPSSDAGPGHHGEGPGTDASYWSQDRRVDGLPHWSGGGIDLKWGRGSACGPLHPDVTARATMSMKAMIHFGRLPFGRAFMRLPYARQTAQLKCRDLVWGLAISPLGQDSESLGEFA